MKEFGEWRLLWSFITSFVCTVSRPFTVLTKAMRFNCNFVLVRLFSSISVCGLTWLGLLLFRPASALILKGSASIQKARTRMCAICISTSRIRIHIRIGKLNLKWNLKLFSLVGYAFFSQPRHEGWKSIADYVRIFSLDFLIYEQCTNCGLIPKKNTLYLQNV